MDRISAILNALPPGKSTRCRSGLNVLVNRKNFLVPRSEHRPSSCQQLVAINMPQNRKRYEIGNWFTGIIPLLLYKTANCSELALHCPQAVSDGSTNYNSIIPSRKWYLLSSCNWISKYIYIYIGFSRFTEKSPKGGMSVSSLQKVTLLKIYYNVLFN